MTLKNMATKFNELLRKNSLCFEIKRFQQSLGMGERRLNGGEGLGRKDTMKYQGLTFF